MLSKRSLFLFLTGSIGLLALTNCSDNDVVVGAGGSSGSSGNGSEAGSSAKGGSAGKAGATNPPGGGTGEGGSPDGEGGAPDSIGGSGNEAGDSAGGTGNVGGGSGGSSGNGTIGEGGSGGEAGAPEPTGPHQNPILKYNFDVGSGLTVLDVSGNGLSATLPVASWAPTGRTGAGLALGGGLLPTTYATVPPGIFKNVKSTTIAAWVKVILDAPWSRIFDFGNAGAGTDTRFMFLTPNTGTGMRFSTYGGVDTREATITTNTVLPTNVWKHVAVTVEEGGKRAIYIDGHPAARATTVDVSPSELEPLSAASYLGKSRFAADAGLNGTLDDFTVYDRVLSPAEIATLAYPKGDYSRLAFDEASGTVSADASDRAVNATLNGATWSSGVPGLSGAAVQLNGVDQFVTLNNPLTGCTTEATIALWVKQETSQPWSRILDLGGTSDNFMFLTPAGVDGKLQLNIHATPPVLETVVLSGSAFPTDGAWHHVAVVLSPIVASLYIDGNVVGNTPLPVTPLVLGATNNNWLGKSRFTDPYFKGAMDELRVSCRAFTSDEIKNLAFH